MSLRQIILHHIWYTCIYIQYPIYSIILVFQYVYVLTIEKPILRMTNETY